MEKYDDRFEIPSEMYAIDENGFKIPPSFEELSKFYKKVIKKNKIKIDYDNYETPKDLQEAYKKAWDYEPSDEETDKRLKAMYPDEY